MKLNQFILLPNAALASTCAPWGPLLPRPRHLSRSEHVINATKHLNHKFDAVAVGKIHAGFDSGNVSFSIGMVSLEDPTPFWTYHHLAPNNADGTRHPDGNSQWMIGSISKVFTDLIMLRTGIDINTPITEYLPELSGPSNTAWENITLSALGSHLAGIGPNYGFPEIYSTIPLWEKLGFPPLSASDFPDCGIEGLNSGYTESQLLEGLKTTHPVVMPESRAVYSSISFALLAYALEAYTNQTYAELLNSTILAPFNLTNTGSIPPNSSMNAVVPPTIPNSWGVDYGPNAAGGGLYSSVNDLSRLMHSILSRRALDSDIEVSSWLQPTAFGDTPHTLVGMPWEIFRTTNLTPKHPHPIDLHAKDGAALGYTSRMAIVDQYGIGMVLLTAGVKGVEALQPLWDAALAVMTPAVEEATRESAVGYIGNYTGELGSMRVAMDAGPGLTVKELTRNSSDLLRAVEVLWGNQPVTPGLLNTDWRMYPMNIEREIEDGLIEEDWRMVIGPRSQKLQPGLPTTSEQPWNDECYTWQSFDTLYYGGEAIDRFVIVREKRTERILRIQSPALRLTMEKV